jgi:hypothetical protein
MNGQKRQDNQIERKPVELKELAVAESLSIVEMSHVYGGNGGPPNPTWPYYGAPAPAGAPI